MPVLPLLTIIDVFAMVEAVVITTIFCRDCNSNSTNVVVRSLKEVQPLVDAVERVVDISFIRSKIVGNTDKRGRWVGWFQQAFTHTLYCVVLKSKKMFIILFIT